VNFRNILAFGTVIVIFPLLWILNGKGIIDISDMVLGMTISITTTIFYFYFRKKEAA